MQGARSKMAAEPTTPWWVRTQMVIDAQLAREKETGITRKAEDYEVLTTIGNGCQNCASIVAAWHVISSQYVAIKKYRIEKRDLELKAIRHEIQQHKMLRHDNILISHCSFVHKNEVWLVTPLMGYGSCRDMIQAHFTEGLPEAAIAYILKDILSALEYIHAKGLIHRAVKASHILISVSGVAMLSGLRHTVSMMESGQRRRVIHHFPDRYKSSLLWASPELLEQNLGGYDTSSDIYSVGIAACELANGIVPFSDIQSTQMLLEKIQGITPRLLDASTMGDPQTDPGDIAIPSAFKRLFSSHFHAFVEACLNSDSAARPSATALLQHTFFKQIRRKSQSESLPDLLRPIQPLTMLNIVRPDESIDHLGNSMAATSLGNTKWSF